MKRHWQLLSMFNATRQVHTPPLLCVNMMAWRHGVHQTMQHFRPWHKPLFPFHYINNTDFCVVLVFFFFISSRSFSSRCYPFCTVRLLTWFGLCIYMCVWVWVNAFLFNHTWSRSDRLWRAYRHMADRRALRYDNSSCGSSLSGILCADIWHDSHW